MLKKFLRCSLVAICAVLMVGALCFIALPKTTTVAKATGEDNPIIDISEYYYITETKTVGDLKALLENEEDNPFYTTAEGFTGEVEVTSISLDEIEITDNATPLTIGSEYQVALTFTGVESTDFTDSMEINITVCEPAELSEIGEITFTQTSAATDIYTGSSIVATVSPSISQADGDDITYTYSSESEGVYTNNIPGFVNAGDHTVYYKANADNHNEKTGTFTVVITPATLTVTADDKTITYGDGYPEYTYTITGYVNSETDAVVSGTATLTCNYNITSAATRGANTYTIAFDAQGLTADNYTFNYVSGTLTVNKRLIYLGVHAGTSVYGSEISGFTANYTGAADHRPIYGDGVSAFGQTNAIFTLSCSVSTTSPVGSYDIIPALAEGYTANYVLDENVENGTYTITPATLTVTADNKTITYGDSAPAYTVTYAGFVNGEDENTVGIFSDTIVASCTYAQYNNANTYAITLNDTVTSLNYSIIFTAGTLTVDQKEVGLTWSTLTAEELVYSGTAKTLSATATGLVNEDTCTVTVALTDANTNVNVGSFTYTATGLSNDNYKLPDNVTSDAYTITKAQLTVTADNKEITYGDNAPEYTYTITGFVNGDDEDDLGGTTVAACAGYDTTNMDKRGVNTYEITLTEGLTSNNYTFSYESGTLTVNKKAITITVNSFNVYYGDAVPTYTFTIADGQFAFPEDSSSDFGGDTVYNQLDGQNYYSVTSPVGEYVIKGSGFTSDNYDISYTDGAVTVSARPITVVITHRSSVYGENQVSLSCSMKEGSLEIVNDDENPFNLSCEVTSASHVGTYDITWEVTNDNYSVTFEGGTDAYEVTKRNLLVAVDNISIEYGDNAPEYTYQIFGFVNGDDEDDLGGVAGATLSCSYDKDVEANRIVKPNGYAITIEHTLTSGDYEIEYQNGVLSVDPRIIRVTITNKNSVYGENKVELTATITNGELVYGDTNIYTLECGVNNRTNVGRYPIIGTLNNNNYTILFMPGVYEVEPREVTLKWTNTEFTYDGKDHKPTATVEGLVNGDKVEVKVVGAAKLAGTYTATAIITNPNYVPADNTTCKFTIAKAATYNKPIDEEVAATDGVNITEVFKNIDTEAEDAELEIKVGETTIVFDKSAISALADAKDVKLVMETKSGEDANETFKSAEMVFEISLKGATFANGTATITAEFENKAPAGKVAKVYYVDENGKLINMNGVFENGKVTFTTSHFSTYIVKYELSGGTIAGIIIACTVFAVLVVFAIAWFVLMKKNFKDLVDACKNAFKKDEEDSKEEQKEEVKEEKVETKKTVKKESKLKKETAPIKKSTKTSNKTSTKKSTTKK